MSAEAHRFNKPTIAYTLSEISLQFVNEIREVDVGDHAKSSDIGDGKTVKLVGPNDEQRPGRRSARRWYQSFCS